jgi:hypothetical protein
MSDVILYTSEDGRSRVQLRASGQTIWLTQAEMAELFDVTTDNISLHLKNIFSDNELDPERTTEESSVVRREGGRDVRRPVTLYNLDAILAVGYRVRSPRGVQFRRWASTTLKEYLLKGFVIDDERLKNPDGHPDHFDEMLARIRDIRASEKRFYQKVRDLFSWIAPTPRLVTRRWRRKPVRATRPLTNGVGSRRRRPLMPPTRLNWPPSKTRSKGA